MLSELTYSKHWAHTKAFLGVCLSKWGHRSGEVLCFCRELLKVLNIRRQMVA